MVNLNLAEIPGFSTRETFYDKLPEDAMVLSPMAGFSDSPYRNLCRQLGSAYSITEFVSTEDLFRGRPSAISLFRYLESERPIVFQVFGNDPNIILRGVTRVLPLQPDGIDLNMGCSVRKVAHHGSGAGLLREPDKVKKIIGSLVKHCNVPVTGKIRLGWDHDNLNYKEIGKILQGEGASAVAIHGRTKQMKYSGKADWDLIGDLASNLSIPVFGNGDIRSRKQALDKIQCYNLKGVFIGRGALGNPWIFDQDQRAVLTYAERLPVILNHHTAMINFYGSATSVLFRKHFTRYTEDLVVDETDRKAILHANDPWQQQDLLRNLRIYEPETAIA